MSPLLNLAQHVGELIDLIGVLVILAGAMTSIFITFRDLLQHKNKHSIYKSFRRNLGRSILLGLEFLVAGDIIRSVTGVPNFTSVGVLVVIVLVRSFLSFTFEMEIEGHWPWQHSKHKE